jgi:hypothetical protein
MRDKSLEKVTSHKLPGKTIWNVSYKMKNKNLVLWQIKMHLKFISYTITFQDRSNDLKNIQ